MQARSAALGTSWHLSEISGSHYASEPTWVCCIPSVSHMQTFIYFQVGFLAVLTKRWNWATAKVYTTRSYHSGKLLPQNHTLRYDTLACISYSGRKCLLKDSEFDEIGARGTAMCEHLRVIHKVCSYIVQKRCLYVYSKYCVYIIKVFFFQAYHVYSLITQGLSVVHGTRLSK